MSVNKKSDLGKGIRALLDSIDSETHLEVKEKKVGNDSASTNLIKLESIEINPFQPRADFDESALQELSDSIKIHGVIQPITVRKISNSTYQLISGERRLRASKMAGLKEIPAYLRQANDQEMLEIALIENIQREDLNSIEIAIHFRRLLDECNLTHEELADRLGKNRTTVTNFLRLLKLPPDIQSGLKSKQISMGHARALIGLDDPIGQLFLFKETITKNLSVREVEELVRNFHTKKSSLKKEKNNLPFELKKLQDTFSTQLATRVIIKRNKQGKGEIVISFFSDDDLFRIKELME